MGFIYKRARSCQETLQVRDTLNRVVFASGFQHSLKAGCVHDVERTPILEIPNFSNMAEAEEKEVYRAYNTHILPIPLQLPTTLGIFVNGIKTLSQVVDPPSLLP